LGASTEDITSDLFPDTTNLFTPEMLFKIKVNSLKQTTPELIKKYTDELLLAESKLGSLEMLSDLNSTDQAVLISVDERAKKLVAALAQISVPSALEEFHKFKMIYYTTLGSVALNLAGEATAADADSSVTIMFSVLQKLESIKSEIFSKYQVAI
jgi:hypothetical protein